MRVFGIDPGSERTGYGCVETDGRRHHLLACGAISARAGDSFPDRLARIHRELTALLTSFQPDCVAVETLFHAANARSALKLGHARGVAILAAVEVGCRIVEYTPAEVKRAVVGYGRAEKQQVQRMITLLLGLRKAPSPYDAADALAVAICHSHAGLHAAGPTARRADAGQPAAGRQARRAERGDRAAAADAVAPERRVREDRPKSWRHYRPPSRG